MDEKLKVIIEAEVSKLQQGVDKAKKQIQTFSQKVAEAKKEVDSKFAAMGEKIKSAANTMGVGIAAVGAALVATAASTEEYRNQQALLVSAFDAAGGSAETAKQTYNDLYRVMGDSGAAVEAAQSLSRVTTEEKALGEYTKALTGIFAAYGEGMPVETIAEAVSETIAAGQVTGDLSRALVEAGVNEDAFNEKLAACNTEAEREKLIRSTLVDLYGESAATYEENNKKVLEQRDAQAKLQEKLAAIGEAIAPVITAFTTFATDALAVVMPYIINLAETYLPMLGEILQVVSEALATAFEWIVQNKEVLAVIGGIIAGVVTAIGLYNAVAAVKAAMDAAQVTTIWGLVAAHAAQAVAAMAALAPYLLIVAAIAAVIAIIVLCVKHWDTIVEAAKNAWQGIVDAWNAAGEWFAGIWENIKGAFANVGSWFSEKFQQAKEGVQQAWQNVGSWFSDRWEDIKGAFSKVGSWFSEKFQQAREGAEKAWQTVGTWAQNTWGKVQQGFATADSWMTEKFGDAWLGVKDAFQPFVGFFQQSWETVKGIFAVVKNVLTGNFADAWQGIKNIFSGWGQFFSDLWQRIVNTFKNIGTKIGDSISGTVKGAINRVLSGAVGIINGFISAINFAIGIINAIPGVNIGKIQKLSVPQLAKGGIVDDATLAVIGEQGKEAVIPLENNLEWLDRLAGMLNDKMGGNNSMQPIVLNVDGKVFGQIACDSINALTRQRGSVPLNFV